LVVLLLFHVYFCFLFCPFSSFLRFFLKIASHKPVLHFNCLNLSPMIHRNMSESVSINSTRLKSVIHQTTAIFIQPTVRTSNLKYFLSFYKKSINFLDRSLLGDDPVSFFEGFQTFGRNILPSSSGFKQSKNKLCNLCRRRQCVCLIGNRSKNDTTSPARRPVYLATI
jgi:hypothetical protein